MKLTAQSHRPGEAWPRQWVDKSGKPQGVALVATLIMLSLVTFMTVAFLGVARRERRSMESHLSEGDAKNAMYAALAAAQSELVARLLSGQDGLLPDPWGYNFFVSTNYMNPNGFNISDPNITNVNDVQVYQFIYPGGPGINETNWFQYLMNLQYKPRVPVFSGRYTNGYSDVLSSAPVSGPTNVEARQGRFYLDFNRNGHYEPTFGLGHRDGVFSGTGHGEWLSNVSAFISGSITGDYVGDPHWIGMLEDPTRPHGPSNQFLHRYAFLVMPAGKSLDLNAIHNQNKLNNSGRIPLYADFDGYSRNHGVGGWELNLAAFIAGLNTNTNQVGVTNLTWAYGNYNPLTASPVFPSFFNPPANFDEAFHRALTLLRFRFNTNFGDYRTMQNLYGGPGTIALVSGAADLTGEYIPSLLDRRGAIDYYLNGGANPWVGATNGLFPPGDREYLTVTELFKRDSLYQQFSDDLMNHSVSRTNIGPLAAPVLSNRQQMQTIDDRYTVYRLLSQLGTESVAPNNKVHLNFDNTTFDGQFAYPDETNKLINGTFAKWTPLRFFTNVGQAILDTQIETNVFYDDSQIGTYGRGFGRYITNYTLGGFANLTDTNRTTLIGGQSRFWNGNTWVHQPREIYYDFITNRITNLVSDSKLKLTNITVFPFNQYTPVLHRLLQVTANLQETAANGWEWDSTRTYGVNDIARRYGRFYRSLVLGNQGQDPVSQPSVFWLLDDPGPPHIFRPIFRYNRDFDSVYISEWVEVVGTGWSSNINYLDVSLLTNRMVLSNATYNPLPGVTNTPYDFTLKGFPFVVGMKGSTRNSGSANQELIGGGVPNFNEISFKNVLTATRKLRLSKTNRNDLRPTRIDTMYILGLRTGIGVEAWNHSRFFSYPRELKIHVTNHMHVRISNGSTNGLYTTNVVYGNVKIIPANSWASAGGTMEWTSGQNLTSHPSFETLLGQYNVVLPESVYYPPAYSNFPNVDVGGALLPVRTGTNNASFLSTNLFPALDLKMVISNWFTYTAIDTFHDRVVDYVNLTNLTAEIDLAGMLTAQTNVATPLLSQFGRYFRTNLVQGAIITNIMPAGIRNQLLTSLNSTTNVSEWRLFDAGLNNVSASVTRFRRFTGIDAAPFGNVATQMFAPFTPTMLMERDLTFQVNDPLVHYMTYQLVRSSDQGQSLGDPEFRFGFQVTNIYDTNLLLQVFGLPGTIGRLNENYRPWGGNPSKVSASAGRPAMREHFNIGLKDPGIFYPDDWDFPQRRFGSIGWMGRVHRGTPWQTIYMKSRVASPEEWLDWEGDPGTHSTNDWKLFDALSAHPSKKAARGLLGINQTNYAAWCAALGGLNYLSNPPPHEAMQSSPDLVDDTIHPTGWQMRRIHRGIVRSRKERTSFTRLSEILSVPELSDGSPYLYRDRVLYNNASTYLPNSQVIHRGIRWTCVAGAGAQRDEMPPSFREHDIPRYNLGGLAARVNPGNISGRDFPFEKNDYVRYVDPSVGVRLYRATTTTTNPPVTAGALNIGWMQSPWREALQNPTSAEMLGMSDNLLERIPQKIMGMLKRDEHPRVVIYAFGQALVPADQSRYLFPGQFQGLVTNYQVIGEVSSRTVLRVEGIPEPGLLPINTNAAPVIQPEVVVEDHKLLGRL